MDDLISVIVPVYKVEKYLSRCVESILAQTYKNFELILVDDGSPDQSGAICDEYALKDKRVNVIHKKNGGVSDARNAGLELQKGEYLTFIDSDDWIRIEYLEHLYYMLKKAEADIAICNYFRCTQASATINQKLSVEKIYEYSNIEALEQFTSHFCTQMIVPWGKLYRAKLFTDIRYPIGRVHEDDFTTHKLIYLARKVVITSKPLLNYFQRSDSIMGSGFSLRRNLDKTDALLERAAFFESIQQTKLRDITYQMAFAELLSLFRNTSYKLTLLSKEQLTRCHTVQNKLRTGKYSFLRKLYYELFFISPYLVDKVYLFIKQFLGKHINIFRSIGHPDSLTKEK